MINFSRMIDQSKFMLLTALLWRTLTCKAQTSLVEADVTLLEFNCFGRPATADAQSTRLELIPASLSHLLGNDFAKVDVITLTEVFDSDLRNKLIDKFKALGFNYSSTKPLKIFPRAFSGGVLVISRWKIETEGYQVYKHCSLPDCLASKGVIYTKIIRTVAWKTETGEEKTTNFNLNVFSTHLQAGNSKDAITAREEQIVELNTFIKKFNIQDTEALFLSGDLNSDYHQPDNGYQFLLQTLEMKPPEETDFRSCTSNPYANFLVGRDQTASDNKCLTEYLSSRGEIVDGAYFPRNETRIQCNPTDYFPQDTKCFCKCCPCEWLDFVMHRSTESGLRLVSSSLRIVDGTVEPYVVQIGETSLNLFKLQNHRLTKLSDHEPVIAEFKYQIPIENN